MICSSRHISMLFGAALCATPLCAQERHDPQSILEFKKLSVQELMDIEVTSVSKNVEHLD